MPREGRGVGKLLYHRTRTVDGTLRPSTPGSSGYRILCGYDGKGHMAVSTQLEEDVNGSGRKGMGTGGGHEGGSHQIGHLPSHTR